MQQVVHASFEGFEFRFADTGWFDATKAAKRYGKRLDHWLSSPETKAYLEALNEMLNYPESGEFIRTKEGRGGGTWLHPKLAVPFARFCDARFAVWCDIQIDALIRDGYARVSDAERSHWQRMLELEKRDETSLVRASFGSHLMLRRKRELPDIKAERERLNGLIQGSLISH